VRRTQQAGHLFSEQGFEVATVRSSGGVTCKLRALQGAILGLMRLNFLSVNAIAIFAVRQVVQVSPIIPARHRVQLTNPEE
jgi:hypothetical protein